MVGGFFVNSTAFAQDFGTNYLAGTSLPTEDVRIVIVNIIRIVLGVLGIIFLGIVLYAGFLWMTAGGNSQQVQKAQKILVNGIIGLVIIVMAGVITQFVFNFLKDAANGGGGPPGSCVEGTISGCSRCSGGTYLYDPGICPLPGSQFGIRDVNTAHGGSDDSQDVYLCSSVQAQFNNVIDLSTVSGNVRLTQGGSTVPTTVNSLSRAIDIVPVSLLAPNTSYAAHYDQGILDSTGRLLSACDPFSCSLSGTEFVWNFTTGIDVDNNAPTITSTNPTSNVTSPQYPSRNANRDQIIKVNFSETVRASSIDDGFGHPVAANIRVEQLDGEGGNIVAVVDRFTQQVITRSDGFDLRFEPPNLFDGFTWYRVTIQNIEDLCGNKMPAPVMWEFETNDKAPGIGNWYPKGTNVCPDVGVVTVSFNTSMLYDQVSINIAAGSATAPPFVSTAIQPSLITAPGPYQVSTPQGIWSTDPASDFKVFTFAFANSLNQSTPYYVTISTNRIIDGSGNVLEHAWDFGVSDAGSCTCAPYVSSINPSEGLLGECTTVRGQCFLGAAPNDPSDPRYAQVSALSFVDQNSNSVPSTIGAVANNYITTSIPTSFASGDFLDPQVTITYNDPALGSISTNNTSVDYFVASSDISQGPCLLNISPAQACFGSSVRLEGERFGNDPGVGNRSSAQNHATYSNGATQVPDSQVTNWQDNRISTLVPVGTVDGNVTVTANGLVSNSVPFDLQCSVGASCDSDPSTAICTDNGACGAGLVCDPSAGCTCQPAPVSCDSDLSTPACTDSGVCPSGQFCDASAGCTCQSTPGGAGAPRVVSRFPTCNLSCTNAALGAVFSVDMNPATLNDSTIDVLPCSDATCTSYGSQIPVTISYDTANWQVNIIPNGSLAVSTNYRVLFSSAIQSAAGAGLGGLNYSDVSGDYYSWTFATKDSACSLSGVSISPLNTTATQLNQGKTFTSYATGSNNQCNGSQYINPWALDWSWTSSNTGVATVTNTDSDSSTLVDPRQIATSVAEGNTNITASTGGFSADGYLAVNVITCNDTTDCTKGGVCPASVCDDGISFPNPKPTNTCTPVITSLSPNTGPTSRWTTVNGCHFGGSAGSGGVTVGGNKAAFPACGGGVWNNDSIIIEIPTSAAMGSNAVEVTTSRGLVSNTANFTVINECLPGVPIPASGVPGLCRIRPATGSVGNNVQLEGVRFGAVTDTVTYAGPSSRLNAAITSWGDTAIMSVVPATAITGGVLAGVTPSGATNFCPSNEVPYNVTASIGSACDSNTNTAQCEAGDNLCGPINNGIYCQPTTCTCQFAQPPAVDSTDPTTNETNVCRNAMITARFNQIMDPTSFAGKVTSNPPIAFNISVVNIDVNNNGKLENSIDQSELSIRPLSTLNPNVAYQFTISKDVLSRYGVPMAADYSWQFITGADQCAIKRVQVTVSPPGTVKSDDTFFCAGNSCDEDQDSGAGNQHRWVAKALDASTPAQELVADFSWSEVDPNNIYSISSTQSADILITNLEKSGRATFSVGAHDASNPTLESATTTMVVNSFICDSPWPARPGFPFVDSSNDFSFWYCRDKGSDKVCVEDSTGNATAQGCTESTQCSAGYSCKNDPADDLPELNMASTNPGGGIRREITLLPSTPLTDIIALRVYDNPEYLSPAEWYRRNVPNPGSPQSTTINGYEAITEGRTVYINAARGVGGSTYAATIYVMSYSQNPANSTRQIFDALLKNWEFTLGQQDLNICSGNASLFCVNDATCALSGAGTCEINATKVRRDAKRVTNLGAVRSLIRKYRSVCSDNPEQWCTSDGDCGSGSVCKEVHPTYPTLTAGSYIVGQSTSKWPSWNETLGNALGASLPQDPLNEFSSCPAGYDQQACWNEGTRTFSCADGSHIYQYEVGSGGTSAQLYANMELKNSTWQGVGSAGSGDSCRSFNLSL